MIEDVEINDNEFLRQFELEVEEQMARIEYALQDRKIFLTKFVMSSDMEDQGFREIFIRAVFKIVENNVFLKISFDLIFNEYLFERFYKLIFFNLDKMSNVIDIKDK